MREAGDWELVIRVKIGSGDFPIAHFYPMLIFIPVIISAVKNHRTQ